MPRRRTAPQPVPPLAHDWRPYMNQAFTKWKRVAAPKTAPIPVTRYPTCLLKLDTAAFAPELRLKSSDFTSRNTGRTLASNKKALSKAGGFQ